MAAAGIVAVSRAAEADQWIAFESDRGGVAGIYLVRATGGLPVRVEGGPPGQAEPAWSPDGRSLAFSASSSAGSDVYVRDRARRVRRLTFDGGSFTPSWSPDGSRIVFARFDRPGTFHVYVMNVDGSGKRRLFPRLGRLQVPRWSPDGGSIAVVKASAVYVVDLATSRRTRIAAGLHAEWLPDGRSIAIVAGQGIRVFDLHGRTQRYLLEHPTGVGAFTLAPEATHVAFVADVVVAGEDEEHLLVAPVGSRQMRTLNAGPTTENPAWQPRCSVYGTEGNDRIRGTAGRDLICGLGGNDRIDAGPGDDVVVAGEGNDVIAGGGGADRLFGGSGSDTIDARGGGRDVVDGGPGWDAAYLGADIEVARSVERIPGGG